MANKCVEKSDNELPTSQHMIIMINCCHISGADAVIDTFCVASSHSLLSPSNPAARQADWKSWHKEPLIVIMSSKDLGPFVALSSKCIW